MSDTGDSTYDTSSYETSSYETTSSETPSYDSGYTASYDVSTTAPTYDTSYAPADDPSGYDAATDTNTVETGSYSYDSTDWSSVSEVSQGYTDVYQSAGDLANNYYQASVEAYLDGDSTAAYDLNQAYLAADGVSDQAWTNANSVWSSMDETTTVTSYDVTDAGWSAAPVEDTSWSAAPADTSWSAAPVEDTSWSAAPADTSWSASADTSTDTGY